MGNGKQLGNGNCIRNSAQAENLTGLGGIGDGAPQQVGQLNHPRYQLAIGFGEDTLGRYTVSSKPTRTLPPMGMAAAASS